MSFVGRPPTPTALKILQGNPGKRPLPQGEPKVEVKVPDCPEWLDDMARQEWDRLMPLLLRMRVICDVDYIQIGILCQNYSMMIQAHRDLKKTGMLYAPKGKPLIGKNGEVIPGPPKSVQKSPLVRIIKECEATINKIAGQYGLTSSGRAKITGLPKEEESSPWARFRK